MEKKHNTINNVKLISKKLQNDTYKLQQCFEEKLMEKKLYN